MRLDRAVAQGIMDACHAQARHDLRWRIWPAAQARYDCERWPYNKRRRGSTPDWFRQFSGIVACQYLSGTWPPFNGWYRP